MKLVWCIFSFMFLTVGVNYSLYCICLFSLFITICCVRIMLSYLTLFLDCQILKTILYYCHLSLLLICVGMILIVSLFLFCDMGGSVSRLFEFGCSYK